MIKIDNKYKTVGKCADAEIVEKRSRFIAYVRPVETEDEALEYLNYIKQKHRDARHNVYAYVIRENNIMRYSDDGEPGGTAGMPVLDIIKKEELCNIIVVVTRYFGGILLGTGGLVHAYSAAAKAGINAAGIVNMVMCRKIVIECDYNMIGKIRYEISEFPEAVCGEAQYGESVSFDVYIPVEKEKDFVDRINDKTNANAKINLCETDYFEC